MAQRKGRSQRPRKAHAAKKEQAHRPGKRSGKAQTHEQGAMPNELHLVGSLKLLTEGFAEIAPLGKRLGVRFKWTPDLAKIGKSADLVYRVSLQKNIGKGGRAQWLAKELKCLGKITKASLDTDIIIEQHQVAQSFSAEAMAQAEALSETVSANLTNRQDLRHLPLVTIDGEDARDFDDAVCIDEQGDLWVAIADVAHFVLPSTPLDVDAAERGNSFYFPDRVLPMLPEKLSNGLCSLKPHEPRLCMALRVVLNAKGLPEEYELVEGVMESKARLTYTEVQALLDGKSSAGLAPKLASMLQNLHELTLGLRKERFLQGSINFDLCESKVIVNEFAEPTQVLRLKQNQAQQLIEECMLLANVCVAQFLSEEKGRVVYRNHPPPEQVKLLDLHKLLTSFGIKVGEGFLQGDPLLIHNTMESLKGRPQALVLTQWSLRAMAQASYGVVNQGHYALGFSDYVHFTSPIRRYSDLLVHRVIKQVLKDKRHGSWFPKAYGSLENLCVHISAKERVAQKAEREVAQRKHCRFLANKVGQAFSAQVMGLVPRGLFVELADYPIEGFLPIFHFRNDHYDYFEAEKAFIGRRRGKKIRLGDALSVRLAKVDIKNAFIDLSLDL